jgi:hypothetical protein
MDGKGKGISRKMDYLRLLKILAEMNDSDYSILIVGAIQMRDLS